MRTYFCRHCSAPVHVPHLLCRVFCFCRALLAYYSSIDSCSRTWFTANSTNMFTSAFFFCAFSLCEGSDFTCAGVPACPFLLLCEVVVYVHKNKIRKRLPASHTETELVLHNQTIGGNIFPSLHTAVDTGMKYSHVSQRLGFLGILLFGTMFCFLRIASSRAALLASLFCDSRRSARAQLVAIAPLPTIVGEGHEGG